MAIHEREPVREFTGDHISLALNLLVRLKEQRKVIVDRLATTDCATFDEYRNLRGKIDGLDIAISLCQEVQAKLQS